MRFIFIVFLSLLSILLSGVFVLFGLENSTSIGYWWWLGLSTVLVTLGIYFRFRTETRLRFFLVRNYLKWNGFFTRVESKVKYSTEDFSQSELQEKAVRLWKLCLKDEDTSISCSISNQTRQIEKNNMLIVLSPINSIDYLMTIMDVDQTKSCLYEVRISQKISEGVISSFDAENERRMRLGEEERRNSIFKDLDKLLLQEEEAVRSKKKTQK